MTISIDLAPELENEIKQAASKEGVSPDAFIVESVVQRLHPVRHRQGKSPKLSKAESDLLQKINQSLSQVEWAKYRELIAKREAEIISPQELLELISISDQLEELNVKRIEHLAELAKIRAISLPALMKELGLKPVAV